MVSSSTMPGTALRIVTDDPATGNADPADQAPLCSTSVRVFPAVCSPIATPGCIVKVKYVSLVSCRAGPTHAGLVLINERAYLAFACADHGRELIASRSLLPRTDAGGSAPRGAAAHRLVERGSRTPHQSRGHDPSGRWRGPGNTR